MEKNEPRPLPEPELSPLEDLLLGLVESRLLPGREKIRDTPYFRMALREVLHAPRLAPEEEEALRARRGDLSSDNDLLRLLTRVRAGRALRALREECGALFDAAAARAEPEIPVAQIDNLPADPALKKILERFLDDETVAVSGTAALGSVTAGFLPLEPEAPGLAPGELLGGKYRVLREIGRGGFGAVYEARDEALDRTVAIKHLNAGIAGMPRGRTAFREEARRIAKLSHPNIVDWKFFDEKEDGSYYFVMELLGGEDLDAVLEREERLAPPRAARILLQVLDALRSAHDLEGGGSILHLDLKPRNVVLLPARRPDGDERVKIIDFGIGQHVGAPAGPGAPGMDAEGPQRLNACTPEYASPEQCRHVFTSDEVPPLDGRSDIYSLGIMAFQMLAGRLPFDPPARRQDYPLLHWGAEPMSLSSIEPGVPRDLARFIEKCLRKEREARWESADAAHRELRRIIEALPAAAPAAPVAPAVRLSVIPAAARAGEGLALRVEIGGVPAGLPLRVEASAEPGGRVVFLGAGPEWQGPAPASSAVVLGAHALAAGPVALGVDVTVEGRRERALIETIIEPSLAPPFAGRAAEKERARAWSEAPGPGLLLLRGEAGAGKSRLAMEVAIEAAARGTAVVIGRARRSFRLPLHVLRQVATTLLRVEGDGDRPAALDFARASLRQRFPSEAYAAEYFGDLLGGGSISPERRSMLPYYWLQLLERAAGGRPLLVILDDLQWSDAETVDLLLEVLGLAHERGGDVKFLGTVQPFGLSPEESRTLSRLDAGVRALIADRVPVVSIDLGPLDAPAVERLVDSFFPGNAFRRDLPWLHEAVRRKSGGNPLLAEWVLKRLRAEPESSERSLLAAARAGVPAAAVTPRWFEDLVPEEVESVIDQRLAALSPEAREVCRIAAAIGDPFDLRLLERLAGGPDALDAALPRLEEEEIIRPSERTSFMGFSHSLIPQRLHRAFAGKSRWRAVRLHARIADTMASTYAERELEEHALARANHLILGDRREEGLKALLHGAGRLLDQQLYASAVEHLERARGLAGEGVPIEGADRALLHLRLGKTYRVLGRLDEALAALDAARGVAEGARDALGSSVDLVRGSILVQQGKLEEAERIFRAVEAADLPDNQLQVAAAVSGRAAVQRIRGRLEEALRDHIRSLELRELAGAGVEVASSCVNIGNTYCDLGRYGEAEEAYRRSIPLYEAQGLKNYLIYALSGLGNVLFRRDLAGAARFYEKAMRLCAETGNRAQLSVLHYNLGEVAFAEHRTSEALREIERALVIMERAGRRTGEAAARTRKAEIHRMLGEHEEATREIERALADAGTAGSGSDFAAARVEAARIALARGEAARAREGIEGALEVLPLDAEASLRLACAQVLIELGDLERGGAILEGAAPASGILPEAQCLLEHLRGLTAAGPAEQRARLEAALALATERTPDLPRLLADLAAVVEPDRARDLLARAVRILEGRAAGIEDEGRRRWFLAGCPAHREVIEQARAAGVGLSGQQTC